MKPILFLAALLAALCCARAESRVSLAHDFAATGDWAQAALEWRRLAADLGPEEGGVLCLLLATDAYRQGGDTDRMARMLERADEAGDPTDPVAVWLHLRLDEARSHWASAMLYAEELRDSADARGDYVLKRHAAGALAADALRAGRPSEARAALADDPIRLEALDAYHAGHDKSPTVGGLLGMVPGLGYAYSGEWGNMLRSIFLNGLFGWAMVECAEHDEWGLFAMTTFFEFTWYTGSIYGGIDAAHRHNRDRLEATERALRGDSEPSVRATGAVPALSVRLSF